jgi:hypothetical protein
MRTQLRDEFEVGTDLHRRAMQIVDAASDDVVLALNRAGRPEAAQAYKAADAFYAQRMRTIDEALEPIVGRNSRTNELGAISGEDVVKNLEAAARGRSRRLEAFVRALPEEEASTVRASLISNLGRPTGSSPLQTFSMETFLTNWNKMTRQRTSLRTVRNVFGPEATAALNDIAEVANASRQAMGYANRSNTAGAAAGSLTLGSAFLGIPTLLVTLGSQAGAGRLLASRRFAKWVARAPRAQDQDKHLARLSGIASAEPAIANEVLQFRDALRASNDNLLRGQAAASNGEGQENQ